MKIRKERKYILLFMFLIDISIYYINIVNSKFIAAYHQLVQISESILPRRTFILDGFGFGMFPHGVLRKNHLLRCS